MKKYPVIGGPLDGQVANYADFYAHSPPHSNGSAYAPWRNEYASFNRGERHKPVPTMVFLHIDLLP